MKKQQPYRTLKRSLVFSSLATLWVAPALADTTEPTLPTVDVKAEGEQPTLNLAMPSSTGSRLNLAIRDTPASVESVDAATMRERGDFNVRDAVTRTTGLTDIATQGDGGVAYSARGFTGNNSVGVLIDGQRMLVGAGTVTDPSNTWGYERIEVLRGAGSIISGTGVTGATINAIRKAPLAQSTGEALFSVGEGGTFRAGVGGTGALGAAGAFRIDAYTETSDGFIDRGDSDGNKIMSTFRFDPNKDMRLELQLDHNDQHPTRYWGTPLINGTINDSIRKRNYNVGDADIKYVDDRIAGRATWQVTPNLSLSDEVSYFTANRRWFDSEEYVYNPGTNQIDRFSFGEIRHHQQQVGSRLEATYQTQGNRLVAGWEVIDINFRHDANGFGGGDSVALNGFDPGTFAGGGETGATPNYRSRSKARAYYIEDAYDLSERLLLVAGLRYDSYDITRNSLRGGPTVDADLDSTALRLGLTYRLAADTSLYAQASTASDPITSLLSMNLANSQFELTKGKQIEAGIKQGFAGGRGEWTGAIYHIKKDDIITRDLNNLGVAIQGGSQSSRGAEFAASYAIGGGWRIDGNLALVDAQFDELVDGGVSVAGKRPPNVARQVANLWVNYGISAWSAGFGARYVGASYADNANTIELPAYTVMDASVAWHMNRQTTFQAIVRNIGDRVYATTAYTPSQFSLGNPRHLELSAEFKF